MAKPSAAKAKQAERIKAWRRKCASSFRATQSACQVRPGAVVVVAWHGSGAAQSVVVGQRTNLLAGGLAGASAALTRPSALFSLAERVRFRYRIARAGRDG
jgi:NhaP-type Na+/H+ or K+/H+ antiporter